MTPSTYQQNVYNFVEKSEGHGQVSALAGSGKTTTLMRCLDLVPKNRMSVTVAFNKAIADELQTRVPGHVKACTLHSYGFGLLRSAIGKTKVEQFKTGLLLQSYFDMELRKDKGTYYGIRKQVSRLVSLAKSEGFYNGASESEMSVLAEQYGIEIKPTLAAKVYRFASTLLQESMTRTDIIDFDDMIFLAAKMRLTGPDYNWVMVDEYQDMNKGQNDLLGLMVGSQGPANTRMLVVGDKNQAIYGFRGAQADIMEDYVKQMRAAELPLNICYRCDKAIIAMAQQIVPAIEARPGAGDGLVENISMSAFRAKVQPRDFVLCRLTAPVVSECLKALASGKPAYVRGKQIGEDLIEIVNNLDGDLNRALTYYVNDRVGQINKTNAVNSDELIAVLHDKVDTLRVFIEITDGTKEGVKSKITELFSDAVKDNSIIFMTKHKSKGLEADRVFILPVTTMKWATDLEQESNLDYVAITRARKELYFVS